MSRVQNVPIYFQNRFFTHDRLRISPWIKSMPKELDITFHVLAQLSGHCDVIINWLWRHQKNENWASETRRWFVKISLFCVRNKIMYVVSLRTICTPTRVLFWCLFPSLLRNSGNKYQYKPLAGAYTVRHSTFLTHWQLCIGGTE